MARVTIIVSSYSINPPRQPVRPNDTVAFLLGGDEEVEEVEVFFDLPTCFDGAPNPLRVTSSGGPRPLTVSQDATPGAYTFSVEPTERARGAGLGVETDIIKGELDVTTEPPPPVED